MLETHQTSAYSTLHSFCQDVVTEGLVQSKHPNSYIYKNTTLLSLPRIGAYCTLHTLYLL